GRERIGAGPRRRIPYLTTRHGLQACKSKRETTARAVRATERCLSLASAVTVTKRATVHWARRRGATPPSPPTGSRARREARLELRERVGAVYTGAAFAHVKGPAQHNARLALFCEHLREGLRLRQVRVVANGAFNDQ